MAPFCQMTRIRDCPEPLFWPRKGINPHLYGVWQASKQASSRFHPVFTICHWPWSVFVWLESWPTLLHEVINLQRTTWLSSLIHSIILDVNRGPASMAFSCHYMYCFKCWQRSP